VVVEVAAQLMPQDQAAQAVVVHIMAELVDQVIHLVPLPAKEIMEDPAQEIPRITQQEAVAVVQVQAGKMHHHQQ
jgi:hypothetical protein